MENFLDICTRKKINIVLYYEENPFLAGYAGNRRERLGHPGP